MANREPAVTYTALARLSVEYSDLEFVSAMPSQVREMAIRKEPQWAPGGWPPRDLPNGKELEAMAMKKLKRLFDFGAPEAEVRLSPEELRTSVRKTWPRVAERCDKGYSPGAFKSIRVLASIWDDGESDWEYSFDGEGAFPPGVATVVRDGVSELDLFLQKLLRADLQERLDLLGAH